MRCLSCALAQVLKNCIKAMVSKSYLKADHWQYETFRLYPGATLITKMCKTAQDLRICDQETSMMRTVTLPAECRVYLSAPGVQYHPKYWPEPGKLDPHRWLGKDWTKNKSNETSLSERKADKYVVAADKTRQMRGVLLTFSDGARSCLGRKFAQAEFVAFLVVVLRRFEIGFQPGVDAEQARRDLNLKSAGRVTLVPIPGFRLALRRRD